MILVLTQCFPPNIGGIEIYVGQLVKALAARGERVTVFADAAAGSPAYDASLQGVTVRRFGGPRPLAAHAQGLGRASPAGDDAMQGHLLRQLEESRAAAEAARAGRRAGAWQRVSGATDRAGDRRVSAALAKAGVVVANSRYTAGLVQPFAHDRLAVKVIHPPIEPLPEAEPRASARAWPNVSGAEGGRCWPASVASSRAKASTW